MRQECQPISRTGGVTHRGAWGRPETGGLPARFDRVEPIRGSDRFTAKAMWIWLVGLWARAVKVRQLKSVASPGVLLHMGCGG